MAISNPSGNYIDKITLPTGTEYTIVDAAARTAIDNMASYSSFLGVISSSAAAAKIEDGSTTASVLVGSTTMTATTGSIVIYHPSNSTSSAQEFIWDGGKWNFFGDIGAKDLGNLAYKSSASSSTKFLTGVSVANTQTASISVSGTYAKTTSVTLTKSQVTVSLSTTSTAPSNTSNYWVYNPSDNLSITASSPGSTSGLFLTGVTGRSVVNSLTYAAPAQTAPTGGTNYTAVDNHNLKLQYIVGNTANAISASTSANALKTVTAPTINKSGTTRYVAPVSVTVTTAVGFGTTDTSITSSGNQKIASITSTSATVTVS